MIMEGRHDPLEQQNNIDYSEFESNVRYYSKIFTDVFSQAKGSILYNIHGKQYIDFFCGAGALNYGHNNSIIKNSIVQYLLNDNIIHGMDMHTPIYIQFLIDFHNIILKPRNFDYKIQFTGPTGANAVEAALKLARLYTKRKNIIFFANSYHGKSLGALSVSDLKKYKENSQVDFNDTIMLPYDNLNITDSLLDNMRSIFSKMKKSDLPAAIILETIQGEGGINIASIPWLQGINEVAHEFGILLIIDDIQVGCGRTGTFFSFEKSAIYPDIVCLSKSLSGYGLPLSIVLIKPELDVWESGEHNGTFRANNLALVGASRALSFWKDEIFLSEISAKAKFLNDQLDDLITKFSKQNIRKRGCGFIYGLEWPTAEIAKNISKISFHNGLIIETVGPNESVLKIMPALTMSETEIFAGIEIIEASINEYFSKKSLFS